MVRNAVDVFGDDDMTSEEEALLEALMDKIIQTNTELVANLDQTIAHLNETHAILEAGKKKGNSEVVVLETA